LVLNRDDVINEAFYSPDGTYLIFRQGAINGGLGDIYAIRGGEDTLALAATESIEHSPALSPNGRWLAYVSNRSGREEVYVRSFPDAGTALQLVSSNGGVDPV